jgi:long-chain fatty acid transport protein
LKTRLPASPLFEKATQEGTDGNVTFQLPWILRAGVENRMVPNLRIELALNFDKWAMHDSIVLTPENIALKNVAGFPQTYNLPPVTLPRHFQDSFAVHLGGEYTLKLSKVDLDLRAGVSFETSAIPNAYTSVLTIDQDKVTAGLGGSLHIGKVRLDAVYAHVFGFNVDVDPKAAQISLISPVAANPPKTPDTINGGHYAARADVIGLGLAYTFDPQVPEDAAKVVVK